MNAVAKNEIGRFQEGYKQLATNIARTLPSHINPERFERATMVAVQRNPDLLAKADRRSLFLSLQRAAQDGLLPDGREGAIVLFGNQAQWMPMVAGLMKLARNSGEITSINAHVAYEGEKFAVLLGDEEHIEHERNIELVGMSRPIAVYAVAKLKGGEIVREVLAWNEVEKVRSISRSKNNGPWVQWTDEMAKKTAIRRLSKRLPLSTDRPEDARLQSAIEAQDNIIEGRADPIEAATEASGHAIQIEHSSKLDVIEGGLSETLDETLDGDRIGALEPDPEPPPPPPARKKDTLREAVDRIKIKLSEAADQDGYNAVMGDSSIASYWKKINADRPELAEELEQFRQVQLDRIAAEQSA